MRILASFLVVCTLLPAGASAAQPVGRLEGFLSIWQSIKRPVLPSREPPFADMPPGAHGASEVTYAKARGLLDDDEDHFHPDGSLTIEDAVVWLLRTRNIDSPDRLTKERLSALLARYPIVSAEADLRVPLRSEDLSSIMASLDEQLRTEQHEVSLYAEKFHGKGTAFGETFDMHAFTAAHRTFPHNTLVKVTNAENGQSVVVRINDRGPFVEGRDMDLSLAAFTAIAPRSRGKIMATFERLGDSSLVQGCGQSSVQQQRIARGVFLISGVPHVLSLDGEVTLASQQAFVVWSVRYPDGSSTRFQDWISPGESFVLTPSIPGEYSFLVGSTGGRKRRMTMHVVGCGS